MSPDLDQRSAALRTIEPYFAVLPAGERDLVTLVRYQVDQGRRTAEKHLNCLLQIAARLTPTIW